MTSDDFARVYRFFARRAPFRPFEVELVSGVRFTVAHPEAIERFDDVFAFYEPDGGHRIFSSDAVAQLINHPA